MITFLNSAEYTAFYLLEFTIFADNRTTNTAGSVTVSPLFRLSTTFHYKRLLWPLFLSCNTLNVCSRWFKFVRKKVFVLEKWISFCHQMLIRFCRNANYWITIFIFLLEFLVREVLAACQNNKYTSNIHKWDSCGQHLEIWILKNLGHLYNVYNTAETLIISGQK